MILNETLLAQVYQDIPKNRIPIGRLRTGFDDDRAGKLFLEEGQDSTSGAARINHVISIQRRLHGRRLTQLRRQFGESAFHVDVAEIAFDGIEDGKVSRIRGVENGEGQRNADLQMTDIQARSGWR